MEEISRKRRKRTRKSRRIKNKPKFNLQIQTYGKLRKKRGSLTGVSAGLGQYFGLDPLLFRIGFVAASFFSGIGLIAYLAMAIFLPMEGEDETPSDGKFRLHRRPNIFDDGIEILKKNEKVEFAPSLTVCPTCDTVSKPNSKFCHKCGTQLT